MSLARRYSDAQFRPLFEDERDFERFVQQREAFAKAALSGELDVGGFTRFLVESGADPRALSTAASVSPQTPLMIAAASGAAEVAKALAVVSDTKARDHLGRTPLALAALTHEADCVDALLPWSDAASRDDQGQTPLMLAGACDWKESARVVQSLLPASDADARDPKGQTALMIAAAAGSANVLEALLAGSDPNAQDADSMTALMRACQKGHVDCARILLPRSDVSKKDKNGKTALGMAGEDKPFQKWPVAELFVDFVCTQELRAFAQGEAPFHAPKIRATLEREDIETAMARQGLPSERPAQSPKRLMRL